MKDYSEKTSLDQIFRIDDINDDSEFIPLLTNEEEKKINAEKIPDEIPILPLRNTVLFPGVVIPITVGRENKNARW
jgi:ATP-dependent Lon protease